MSFRTHTTALGAPPSRLEQVLLIGLSNKERRDAGCAPAPPNATAPTGRLYPTSWYEVPPEGMVYQRHANDITTLDTLESSPKWELDLNNHGASTQEDAPLVDRFRWEYLNKKHDTDRLFKKALFRVVEDEMGDEDYVMVDEDQIKVDDEIVDEDEMKDEDEMVDEEVILKDGGRARWLAIASWKDEDPAGTNGYLKWIHDSTPYVGCDLVALQILCNKVYLAERPEMLLRRNSRPFAEYDPAAFLMSYAKVQNYKYYMLRKAAVQRDGEELVPTRPDDVQQMYKSLHRMHSSTVSFVTTSFLDAIRVKTDEEKTDEEKEASYVAFYTVAFPGPYTDDPSIPEGYEQKAEAARFYINPFCDYIYGKFKDDIPLYNEVHTYDARGPFIPTNVGFVRNDRGAATAMFGFYPKNNGVFPNEKQADIFRQWHDLFWDKVLDNYDAAEKAVVIDGDYLFYCSKRLREDFDLRLTAAKTSIDWAIIMCDDMLLDLTKGDIETNMQTTIQKARRSRVGRYFFGEPPLMPTPAEMLEATTLDTQTSYARAVQTIAGSYNVKTDLKRDPDDLRKLELLLGKVENLATLLWHPCGSLHGQEKEAYERVMQADRLFVLAAVHQDGNALRYAAEALKTDREIVLAAVRQCPHALNYAADALKTDLEVVRAAMAVRTATSKRGFEEDEDDEEDDEDDEERYIPGKKKQRVGAFLGIMHINPMHVRWSVV